MRHRVGFHFASTSDSSTRSARDLTAFLKNSLSETCSCLAAARASSRVCAGKRRLMKIIGVLVVTFVFMSIQKKLQWSLGKNLSGVTVEKISGKESNFSTPCDAAIAAWLDNQPATVRVWAKKLFKRRVQLEAEPLTGRELLRRLNDSHGVPPGEVLSELAVQEKFRNRKMSDDAKALSSAKETASLLRLLDKAIKGYRLQLEHLGIAGHLERASKELRQMAKAQRGRPKKHDARAALLPLVALNLKYSKQPLWSYVAALASAAFVDFSYADGRRSAHDILRRAGDSSLKSSGARPLHEIESQPARRAAVDILAAHAKQVADEMLAEKIQGELDTRPKPKPKKDSKATSKDTASVCARINCADLKKRLEKFASSKKDWYEADQHGGYFFRCARCRHVRHSACDGLNNVGENQRCGRCTKS